MVIRRWEPPPPPPPTGPVPSLATSPANGNGNGAAADVGAPLCRAALAMLTEQGVAGLTLSRVDRRAGLPVGTCRARFRTRRGLVAAMLETTAADCRDYLAEAVRRHPGDPVAALVAMLRHQLGPGRDTTRALWAALMDPGVRPAAELYADALLCLWDRHVADLLGLDLPQYRLIWPMMQGLVSHTIMRNHPAPDADTMIGLVHALLDLVKGRPAAA